MPFNFLHRNWMLQRRCGRTFSALLLLEWIVAYHFYAMHAQDDVVGAVSAPAPIPTPFLLFFFFFFLVLFPAIPWKIHVPRFNSSEETLSVPFSDVPFAGKESGEHAHENDLSQS